jgi:hypothetical protein
MFRRERLRAALLAVACGYAAMWLVHVIALLMGDAGSGWIGACELIVFGFTLATVYKRAAGTALPARAAGVPIYGSA